MDELNLDFDENDFPDPKDNSIPNPKGFKTPHVTDEFDPRRCQATIYNSTNPMAGQCRNYAVPGLKYCKVHGANSQEGSKRHKAMSNYRLTKWKAQLEEQLQDPEAVISLRDEIGILRILIQERLNVCNDVNDLLLNSTNISDLVSRVERVIVSCQKIETLRSGYLDKSRAIQLASEMVSIISKYVKDGDIIEKIGLEVGQAVIRTATAQSD